MSTLWGRCAWAVAGLALAALAGCSGSKETESQPTVQTKGQLVYEGKPEEAKQFYEEVTLVFNPLVQANELNPIYPKATVKESGEFTLSTYKTGDGAPAGDYKITLVWKRGTAAARKKNILGGGGNRGGAAFADSYRGKYGPNSTPLKATIAEDGTMTPDTFKIPASN